jgi:hypothetical protein
MKDSSDAFPTIMQCDELMAMVKKGPQVLELRSIVQFPILKPGSYSLADFLEALLHCDTIRTVRCNRHFTTGFGDEEWCQILLAFGQVPHLNELVFVDGGDSRLRRIRIDVLADVLHTAQKLRKLEFGKFWLLMGNDDNRRRFARSLEHHPTLTSFLYEGCGFRTQLYQSIAPRSQPDAIISALRTCPNMQSIQITSSPYCAPDYTTTGLEQLFSAQGSCTSLTNLSLVTQPSRWGPLLAARQRMEHQEGSMVAIPLLERLVLTHCVVRGNHYRPSLMMPQALTTSTTSTALPSCCSVEDVARVADGLKHSVSLRHLSLRLWGSGAYFPQQSGQQRISQAFADALRVNASLRFLELSDYSGHGGSYCSEHLSAKNLPPKMINSDSQRSFDEIDYEILAAAVRDNGRVQIYVDVGLPANDDGMKAAYDNVRIESNLNAVGRGRLVDGFASAKTDWCEALSRLKELCHKDDGPVLQSCLYQLLRLHPLLCCRGT